MAILVGDARTSEAGLVLEVQTSSARPGQVGDLFVTLSNVGDGSGATYRINAFEFGLSLGNQAGIHFQGADRDTNLGGFSYIFQPNGPGDLSYSSFPGPDLFGSDSAFNLATNFRELGVGDVVGLGHISYQMDPAVALGTVFNVAINSDFTDLSDPNGVSIPLTLRQGKILTSGAVPEPSSFVLGLAGFAILGASRSWCLLGKSR